MLTAPRIKQLRILVTQRRVWRAAQKAAEPSEIEMRYRESLREWREPERPSWWREMLKGNKDMPAQGPFLENQR